MRLEVEHPMRFLESINNAILNRSPDELIGALFVAAGVAVVVSGVYALGRRKSSPSPSFVGGLALASGALCMALAAGYIEYMETGGRMGSRADRVDFRRRDPRGSPDLAGRRDSMSSWRPMRIATADSRRTRSPTWCEWPIPTVMVRSTSATSTC
jgi:hypothetical protein